MMLSSQLAKRCDDDGGGDEYDDVRGDVHDDEHDEHGNKVLKSSHFLKCSQKFSNLLLISRFSGSADQ